MISCIIPVLSEHQEKHAFCHITIFQNILRSLDPHCSASMTLHIQIEIISKQVVDVLCKNVDVLGWYALIARVEKTQSLPFVWKVSL